GYVGEAAIDEALERLRERSARYEPVEGRGVAHGDSVLMDLVRTARGEPAIVLTDADAPVAEGAGAKFDHHHKGAADHGGSANPRGFEDELLGLETGAQKTFDVRYPDDYAITELAGKMVTYDVSVKALRTRIVPELDDEFAKDLGDFASLDALRARVREDL